MYIVWVGSSCNFVDICSEGPVWGEWQQRSFESWAGNKPAICYIECEILRQLLCCII